MGVAAVALGACVVEKHVTLSRAEGGPDSGFSLEPEELQRLVDEVGVAWDALGGVAPHHGQAKRPRARFADRYM